MTTDRFTLRRRVFPLFAGAALCCPAWLATAGAQAPLEKAAPESKVPAEAPATEISVGVDVEEVPEVGLLERDTVRTELKITDEQRQKIQELIRTIRQDISKARARLKSEETQTQVVKVLKDQSAGVYNKYKTQVEEILTPEQRQRLRELYFQFRGMKAVTDPEIAQALKLTSEQQKQIDAAIADAKDNRHDIRVATRKRGKVGRQERRTKLESLRKDVDSQISALLTVQQRELFLKIQGPDFDFGSAQSDFEDGTVELGAGADTLPAETPPPAKAETKPAPKP